MNKWITSALITAFVFLIANQALAGDFDGSKPLICALMDLVECQPGGQCQSKSAEELGLPQFVRINFQEKKISGTQSGGSERDTAIERLEQVDGKLIIQGAEGGG